MLTNSFAITPISAAAGKEKEGRHQRAPAKPTAIDLRVQDLISGKVSLPRVKESSLLATAVDPSQRMVLHSGAETSHQVEWEPRNKGKEPRLPGGSSNYIPIGLKRCEAYPWINALMQFLLFLPTCREVLSYLPKSLQGVREFADRYSYDLEAKSSVSFADGFQAAGSLLNKFPNLFRENDTIVNLDEALQLIWKSASSIRPERPSWQMLWDSSEGIEVLLAQEETRTAFEWLVGLKQLYDCNPQELFRGACLERQYLLKQDHSYMEMDAFIEVRPDEGRKVGYYTYMKLGGTWVQCADEKVSFLRGSRSLEMPLQRGVLFHFRRVPMRG